MNQKITNRLVKRLKHDINVVFNVQNYYLDNMGSKKFRISKDLSKKEAWTKRHTKFCYLCDETLQASSFKMLL